MKTKKTTEELLTKMLSVIGENPGIRPSQLNLFMHMSHSWSLRKTLIARGLVRKERRGTAVFYYQTRPKGEKIVRAKNSGGAAGALTRVKGRRALIASRAERGELHKRSSTFFVNGQSNICQS